MAGGHTCYQQKSANSTRVYERFSFSLLNYAEMCICFIETEIWNGRKVVNTPGNISDMFSGDASHSRRLAAKELASFPASFPALFYGVVVNELAGFRAPAAKACAARPPQPSGLQVSCAISVLGKSKKRKESVSAALEWGSFFVVSPRVLF